MTTTRYYRWLDRAIHAWMRVGARIARGLAFAMLTMVFACVLIPTAWLVRWFRPDPLKMRWNDSNQRTTWHDVGPLNAVNHPENVRGSRRIRPRGLIAEFVLFLFENKKWWLIPLMLSLAFVAVVSLLTSSPAAPFIYTLF